MYTKSKPGRQTLTFMDSPLLKDARLKKNVVLEAKAKAKATLLTQEC